MPQPLPGIHSANRAVVPTWSHVDLPLFTRLERAIAEGKSSIVSQLAAEAKDNAQGSLKTEEARKLLVSSISTKKDQQIKQSLTELLLHFDVHFGDRDSDRTILSLGAETGDTDFCRYLLRMGATPNPYDPHFEKFSRPIQQLMNAANVINQISIKPESGKAPTLFEQAWMTYDVDKLHTYLIHAMGKPLNRYSYGDLWSDALEKKNCDIACAFFALAAPEWVNRLNDHVDLNTGRSLLFMERPFDDAALPISSRFVCLSETVCSLSTRKGSNNQFPD
jgi:hypothetical protein